MNQHGLLQLGGFSLEVSVALLLSLLALAAWFDIKSRRIPNWLVLAGLVLSLGIQLLFGGGGFSAWASGLLVGFGTFLPLYLLRAMGAGDVKLMAMVGAFLGPASALGAVLVTLVTGGILAIAVALWSGALRRTLENVRFLLTDTMLKSMTGNRVQIAAPPASAGSVPYAVAITAGTFIHLFLVRSGNALFV